MVIFPAKATVVASKLSFDSKRLSSYFSVSESVIDIRRSWHRFDVDA